jgi:hypothetical protein
MSDEQPVIEPSSGDGTGTEAQSAPAGGNDGSNAQGAGRSPDNMFGELSRKYKKLDEKIDALTTMLREAKQAPQTPSYSTPTPPQQDVVSRYGAPRPLQQYSDDQLAQAFNTPGFNDYQKQQISQELKVREDERLFDRKFQEREHMQRVSTLKAESESLARAAYPALRDPDSQFSQRVQSELQKQRKLYGEFPTDHYDVAHRVAESMGLQRSKVGVPGFVAQPGSDRQTEPEGPQGMSDDEYNVLARRFQDALPSDVGPDGRLKRRTFDKSRIQKRTREYQAAENVQRSRGVKFKGDR